MQALSRAFARSARHAFMGIVLVIGRSTLEAEMGMSSGEARWEARQFFGMGMFYMRLL